MHGISNRHTHLYPPHNNLSVFLTTTELWRSGWITDGMRSGWTTLRDSVLPFPTSAPTLMEWPCQEPGSDTTASAQGSNVYHSCWRKWGMAPSAACECDAEEQTVDHVFHQCTIHRPPHGLHGLTVLYETIEWLLNTCPEI